MINFFTPSTDDASLQYLSKIFGNVNGVIPGTGGTITLLGTMFTTFNSTLLAVGALIVVYITVVGVMMTAHEGEFMKKWNSLWTPIRVVLGITALVPTASGFSGLQIIMMWVIVQGVGAADTLWNTVLGYVNYTGSPFASITPPSTGVSQSIKDIFKAITCDESARATYSPPYVTDPQSGGYYCNGGNSWCSSPNNIDPSQTSTTSFSFGPQGSCGTLSYCNQTVACTDSTSLGCQTCKAQVTALSNIITTLRGTAGILIKADYDYQNFYINGILPNGRANPNARAPEWLSAYCTAQSIPGPLCRGPVNMNGVLIPLPAGLPDPKAGTDNAPDNVVQNVYWPYAVQPQLGTSDFVQVSVAYYMNALGTAISTYIAGQVQNTNTLSGQFAAAQKTGWIFAGAYYYTIVQNNNKTLQDSLPSLTIQYIDPETGTTSNPNVLQGYRNNLEASKTLLCSITGTCGSGGEAAAAIADGSSSIGASLLEATNPGDTNPVVQLASAGYGLLMAAQILFLLFITLAVVIGLVSGINIFALGTGGFNPMAVASPMLFMILVPMLFGLMGLMVSMGATLAVYVPLIPYVIFTFGAIGWLTSTIEAMVAGPLVAIGIMAPGGHHEILGKAEPALMLLFNVFLRPSLMIFGLIAAMLLANVVVTMINAMFFQVMMQIIGIATTGSTEVTAASQAAAGTNILELVFFLIAYVGLIISALNKCFAAIHIIPERVMAWIGGQGMQFGEGEAVSEMKRGLEGGAATAGGAMKAGPGEMGAGAEEHAKSGAGGGGKEQRAAFKKKREEFRKGGGGGEIQ